MNNTAPNYHKKSKIRKISQTCRAYFKLDALGTEPTYYILYRQGKHAAYVIEESVGKTSCGVTGAKATMSSHAQPAWGAWLLAGCAPHDFGNGQLLVFEITRHK